MLKQMRNKIGVMAVVMATLLVAVTGAVGAQDAAGLPTNTITVTGVGDAFGSPDIAYLYLGVQTTNEDVVVAFNEANEKIEQLIAALKEFGIGDRDLQTAGLSMYMDTFDPMTGGQRDTPTYQVTNSLSITIRDVTQVGEVISLGVNNGANSINGPTFGIADPAAMEQIARSEAVDNARARAQQLAELTGKTLGDPIIISETFGNVIPFASNSERAQSGGGAASVEEGQLSVSVNVQVTFSVS